ncbi:MAG: DNA polymerase III subunit delta [Oligoflexia bacterium]|nr:DNA polymerase III subunit delta [Oligoflexia bacterium]
MSTQEAKVVSQKINQGQFAPLYLFTGDEVFMIDELLSLLKEKVIGDSLADFNLNTFYASDVEVETIIDTVQTLPMMAPRRLVIVKQAEDFNASELEKLACLVDEPVDTTTLVFVANKVDMRKKFFKLFDQNGVVVKFQKPFENQLAPWIHHIAKKHGVSLTPQAVELVRECVGAHLSDINNELAKAVSYVGSVKSELDVDDLKSVISRTRVDSVFQLVNSMSSSDTASALTYLANLLEHGENEIAVLTMIIRHYRILLLCNEGLREGLSAPQIASRVGVHGFFIKDYIQQARSQNVKSLERIYAILLDTDRALKSNPLASHIWLENLILQSCKQPVSLGV